MPMRLMAGVAGPARLKPQPCKFSSIRPTSSSCAPPPKPALVDGVTTNPSLIAKSGRNMFEVIAEICDLVEGPVKVEAGRQ